MGAPLRFVVNGKVSGQGVGRGCTSYFAFRQATYVSSMGLLHQIRGDIFSQLCFFLPIGRWSCCSISLFHLGEPCAEPLRLNVAAFSTQLSRTFRHLCPNAARDGKFLSPAHVRAGTSALSCVGIALRFCRSATDVPKDAVIEARILCALTSLVGTMPSYKQNL